jgi:hypothetical protein
MIGKKRISLGPRALIEPLETRTLLSGYTATLIAPVPVRTAASAAGAATLVRNPATGELYGFDTAGGPNSAGIVYQVDPSTKTLTTITTFQATSGPAVLLQIGIDSNGNLFGISQNSTTAGGTFENAPATLFELPAGNFATPVVLFTFGTTEGSASAYGTLPVWMVVDSSNNVDVLSATGGASDGGVIDQFRPAENYLTPHALGSLPGSYSAAPNAFALGSSGAFFGTTASGGANTAGSLWELPAGASVATNLASFGSTTGAGPAGSLYVDSQNDIFGVSGRTTELVAGGVWEFNQAAQQLSIITPFTTADFLQPTDGLIGDSAGNLYGTSAEGLNAAGVDAGSFFKVDVSTHALTISSIGGTTLGIDPLDAPTPDGAGDFFIVTSFDAANNAGAVVEVSPGGGGGGTGPLSSTVAASTVPASVVGGVKTHGVVSVTVTNTGATTSSGKDTFALFASTDGAIDGSSIPLNSIKRPVVLKAGREILERVPVNTAALPAGTYTILEQTTDSKGNITATTTGPTLTVVAPSISLSASIGLVSPSLVKLGRTGTFKLTITNSGNINSTGLASIAIGLSADGVSEFVPLTTVRSKPTIRPSKSVTIVLHLKIAKAFSPTGTYEPFVSFAQGSNTVTQIGSAFTVG